MRPQGRAFQTNADHRAIVILLPFHSGKTLRLFSNLHDSKSYCLTLLTTEFQVLEHTNSK